MAYFSIRSATFRPAAKSLQCSTPAAIRRALAPSVITSPETSFTP